MIKFPNKMNIIVGAIGIGLGLSACQKNFSEKDEDNNALRSNPDVSPAAVSTDLPGRTLAANCFQCHGTNGFAGELKIAGQDAQGMISKLNYFRSLNPRSNIMNVHALGYTPEDIALIADFFSKQKG